MERTHLNSKSAALAILLLTLVSGCESPFAYHLKHYHSPFRAIAESNKTYYHSSQTGRVIPKDPCAKYCEPSCFGFEPTCWTPWPEECVGNCPMEEIVEVIETAPAIPEPAVEATESDIEGLEPTPASPSDLGGTRPSPPTTGLEPNLPSAPNFPTEAPRQPNAPSRTPVPDSSPTIPVDEESSIPSPSDATRKLDGIRKIRGPVRKPLPVRTPLPATTRPPKQSSNRPLIKPGARRTITQLPSGVFQEISGTRLTADKVRPQLVKPYQAKKETTKAHSASTRRLTDIRPAAAWPSEEPIEQDRPRPPRRLEAVRLPQIETAAPAPKTRSARVPELTTSVSTSRDMAEPSGLPRPQSTDNAPAEIRFVSKASPQTKRLSAIVEGDDTSVRFR